MIYTLKNGKNIKIDDSIIEKSMKVLGLSKDEAIQMYIEDEGIEINEEQEALTKVAKDTAPRTRQPYKKADAPAKRERKQDEEKRALINKLFESLSGWDDIKVLDVSVANPEREVTFMLNGNAYSVTLTKHRQPKNK